MIFREICGTMDRNQVNHMLKIYPNYCTFSGMGPKVFFNLVFNLKKCIYSEKDKNIFIRLFFVEIKL